MATRFKSLKLVDTELFGVALSGSIGRSDHKSLQDLAKRALADGKVHVVLDLKEVTSIGGGGVKLLAQFQKNLIEAGGEMVFVGASEVMKEYLARNFSDLPQNHFASVDDLCQGKDHGSADSLPDPQGNNNETKDTEEVGATGSRAEDSTGGLDGVLGGFKGKGGARRHFVSLTEAVESFDFFASDDDQHRLTQALSDLLYGHDLARSVELLTRQDDCLLSTSGLIAVPFAGGIIPQILAARRPMTILDLDNDVLLDEEITMLSEHGPDLLLPIILEGELFALLYLMNDVQEREYTVSETLALELLMQVMSGAVADQQVANEQPQLAESESSPKTVSHTVEVEEVELAPSDIEAKSKEKSHPSLDNILLRLAEDLPEADDADHFWTLFAKHTAANLGVARLAYMDPDSDCAHLYVGEGGGCLDLKLGDDRFQVFLRSVERPVLVENLPKSFSGIGNELIKSGIQWIISLNWDEEYLGVVLLQLEKVTASPAPAEFLTSIMDHIARHMARFSGNHNQHDINLDVVRVLMGQREKRCFGSDEVTEEVVRQVQMLAQEMGFPPAQERDLIYGCLLRDLGLVAKEDNFTTNPGKLAFEDEYLYRRHPAEGALMLAGLDLPPTIVEVVQGHHERFNGEGYPLGQKGREIPLAARVVSVVEHYVFMITGAGGTASLAPSEAAEILRLDEEGRFDPDIVQIFLSAIQRPNPVEEINKKKIEGKNQQDIQETELASPSLSTV